MATNYSPKIATDSISQLLDAGNIRSYPGTGNTLFDLSKNKRNSIITGPTFNGNGYLEFLGQGERDGSPAGDYISLNTNATRTDPGPKPEGVTYQWWMQFSGNQANGHSLFYGNGTVNHIEWRGSDSAGYFRTEARTQNGYSFGGGSPPGGLPIGEWHHLSIVFANNEPNRPVRWYKDGELYFTGDMTSGSNPGGEYFIPSLFGRATGSSSYLYAQSFRGYLSQIIIYDKPLTDNEIKQNYNATRGRHGK